jgi:nucleoside-diphosphate-sugar epimerase
MKILITGSTGFLGKAVIRLIDKKKYNLYFLTRRKGGRKIIFIAT